MFLLQSPNAVQGPRQLARALSLPGCKPPAGMIESNQRSRPHDPGAGRPEPRQPGEKEAGLSHKKSRKSCALPCVRRAYPGTPPSQSDAAGVCGKDLLNDAPHAARPGPVHCRHVDSSPAHPFGGADLYPSKRAHPGGLCGCYDSFAGVLLLPPNELPSASSSHGDGL